MLWKQLIYKRGATDNPPKLSVVFSNICFLINKTTILPMNYNCGKSFRSKRDVSFNGRTSLLHFNIPSNRTWIPPWIYPHRPWPFQSAAGKAARRIPSGWWAVPEGSCPCRQCAFSAHPPGAFQLKRLLILTQAVYFVADLLIVGLRTGELQKLGLQFRQSLVDIVQCCIAFVKQNGFDVLLQDGEEGVLVTPCLIDGGNQSGQVSYFRFFGFGEWSI